MNWKQAIARGTALASLVAFGTGPILAQPGMGGPRGDMSLEERMESRVAFLDQELELSDEQEAAIREILERAHAEAAVWHEEHADAARDDRSDFRREHRGATDAAIKEVLTEEQRTTLESLREHQRGRRHHRRGDRSGDRGMRGLDLSDAQKDQLKALRADHRAAVAEILTPEQNAKFDARLEHRKGHRRGRFGPPKDFGRMLRQLDLSDTQNDQLKAIREEHRAEAKAWREANPEATRADRRAHRKEHRQAMETALSDILTEEQMDKFTEMREQRKGRWGHSPQDN